MASIISRAPELATATRFWFLVKPLTELAVGYAHRIVHCLGLRRRAKEKSNEREKSLHRGLLALQAANGSVSFDQKKRIDYCEQKIVLDFRPLCSGCCDQDPI